MNRRRERRVLALYPCARGVGFALMDYERRLLDWGIRDVRGRGKNRQSFRAMTDLIEKHRPSRVAIENVSAAGSRRHIRIKALHAALERHTSARHIRLRAFTRAELLAYFSAQTKHERARAVAEAYPALRHRMPPKRKPWMSEDARQGLFDAVALALVCIARLEGRPAGEPSK